MWIRRLNRTLLTVAFWGGLAATGAAREARPAAAAGSPIEDLRAKSVEVRRNAANAVRLADRDVQRQALPALIDLLKHEKDGQVRLAVLDAVTALGRDAEAAVPALVHTLRTNYGGDGQEESHQDYRSALALAAIGKPAVEGLRGLLKERKESVRAEVVMGLGRIGPDAAAAVPDLIPLLGDRSERIRRETSLALGRIGASAVEPLVAASKHRDATVRAAAAEGLGDLPAPDDRAQRAVIACARDAAPEVRAAALRSLSRFPQPDADLLPILAENLRHDDERVRLAVVNWLVGRRALIPALAPELESLLAAPSDGVSRHAAFLLGKLGPEAVPRLINALRDPNSRIDQVAEALAQVGRPAVKRLIEAVKDPEPRIRRGAALALGRIRPLAPGTAQTLTAGLTDPDRAVKAAFLTAIGDLGPRGAESVPALRVLLKDESAEIRARAIEVLALSAPRDDRWVGDLTALVSDADARVQRRAIDTLRAAGPASRKALGVVIGRLDSTDPNVRLAAAEFIGSHGPTAAEAVPALGALLDDPSPKIRIVAAQAMGEIGKAAQPALPRLTRLLDAPQAEVRQAATTVLGSLDLDVSAIRPHLARSLRDDNAEVRRAASRAIQKFGPDGALFVPDIILLAEKKEDARSAERLLRRFERRGPDPRSLPELVKQLEHKQPAVRLLAIKFLGLAGGSARDAIPALERMREDPDAEVRKQATAACERIRNNAAPARKSDGV